MVGYLEENRVHQGRSEDLMQLIRPESVHLSFWSPPYFVGKSYEKSETYESWQAMLKTVIAHHSLALKPGAFLAINIADIKCFKDASIPKFQGMNLANQRCKVSREMVLRAKKQYPDWNRDQLAKLLQCSEQTIDRRLNGNNIRGGKYETQTRVKLVGGALESYAYEVGLYLYDHRIWAKDAAWANSRWTNNTLKSVDEFEDLFVFWKPGEQIIDRDRLSKREWLEWGSRGLWQIASVRANDDHEAKFPIELAERVIRLYSAENDLVLDPFAGSGTTAIASLKWNRRYVGIEKEHRYVQLAQQNIKDSTAQQSLPWQSVV